MSAPSDTDDTDYWHPNVHRVVAAATGLGLAIRPVRFPDGAKTAADAAAAIGVDVGQIVKSLIFAVDGDVVLAYVSGANQLDERKLAAAAGGDSCGRVDADTVRRVTGYPIGGVPPFGHATPLPPTLRKVESAGLRRVPAEALIRPGTCGRRRPDLPPAAPRPVAWLTDEHRLGVGAVKERSHMRRVRAWRSGRDYERWLRAG